MANAESTYGNDGIASMTVPTKACLQAKKAGPSCDLRLVRGFGWQAGPRQEENSSPLVSWSGLFGARSAARLRPHAGYGSRCTVDT